MIYRPTRVSHGRRNRQIKLHQAQWESKRQPRIDLEQHSYAIYIILMKDNLLKTLDSCFSWRACAIISSGTWPGTYSSVKSASIFAQCCPNAQTSFISKIKFHPTEPAYFWRKEFPITGPGVRSSSCSWYSALIRLSFARTVPRTQEQMSAILCEAKRCWCFSQVLMVWFKKQFPQALVVGTFLALNSNSEWSSTILHKARKPEFVKNYLETQKLRNFFSCLSSFKFLKFLEKLSKNFRKNQTNTEFPSF